MTVKLGVNVDHIATLRQARKEEIPDLIDAVKLVLKGGADSIVAHLREDRRHIQDKDIRDIRSLAEHFDLEMASTREMMGIAIDTMPDIITLVPEKRKELTTEGGLDVKGNVKYLIDYVGKLESKGIAVSMFIDPVKDQIEASKKTGASYIELHTGMYALAGDPKKRDKELEDIRNAVKHAKQIGLRVNAGHGLNYENTAEIASIDGVEELNIGFSIIAKSIYTGIEKAVAEMKAIIRSAK